MRNMMPPWGMPWWMWGPQGDPNQHQRQVPEIIVPARVNKAMELLDMLHRKQMKRGAVGEGAGSVLELDGLALTQEETNASDAALQMLTKYFDGKLEPDKWEMLRYKALEKQIEMGGKEGAILRCIACAPGPPNPTCDLCKGSGRVFITPMIAAPMPTDEDDDDGPPNRPRHPEVDP